MKSSITIIIAILCLNSCAIFGQQSATNTVEKCGFLPHCVSSKDDRSRFKIEHHKFSSSKEDMHKKLLTYLKQQKNVDIVKIEESYIHATYTSKRMKFIDDVEFELRNGVMHIRSISRIGIGDWGVNRKRVTKILKDLK